MASAVGERAPQGASLGTKEEGTEGSKKIQQQPQEQQDQQSAFDRHVSGDARHPRLVVALWRALVVPLLRVVLRLAMRSTVSTAHSMVRAWAVRCGDVWWRWEGSAGPGRPK